MQNHLTRALEQCLERITALTDGNPDSETLRVHCYATEVLKEARRESMADHVLLTPDMAEDLENALDAAVGQLQLLGDSGMCTQAGESALKRYRKAREQPQASAIMGAALETFDGPLRLSTICLEQAIDGDLDALSRMHCLNLATVVDDWKTRAEMRMMEFERSGPEKSGTG